MLTGLDELTVEMAGPLRFAAGIAYYLPCAYASAEFYASVLILIREKNGSRIQLQRLACINGASPT